MRCHKIWITNIQMSQNLNSNCCQMSLCVTPVFQIWCTLENYFHPIWLEWWYWICFFISAVWTRIWDYQMREHLWNFPGNLVVLSVGSCPCLCPWVCDTFIFPLMSVSRQSGLLKSVHVFSISCIINSHKSVHEKPRF